MRNERIINLQVKIDKKRTNIKIIMFKYNKKNVMHLQHILKPEHVKDLMQVTVLEVNVHWQQ